MARIDRAIEVGSRSVLARGWGRRGAGGANLSLSEAWNFEAFSRLTVAGPMLLSPTLGFSLSCSLCPCGASSLLRKGSQGDAKSHRKKGKTHTHCQESAPSFRNSPLTLARSHNSPAPLHGMGLFPVPALHLVPPPCAVHFCLFTNMFKNPPRGAPGRLGGSVS